MTITIHQNGTELTVAIEGRLDTMTAPQLERQLEPALDGVETLIFDFAALEYISSAGLRVILGAIKVMEEQGELIVRNVIPEVMEIFEVTGFIDLLTIE